MKKLIIALICLTTIVSHGQDLEAPAAEKFYQFGLKAETVFPIFIGPSATLSLGQHFETSVGFGLTPEPYYNVIANVSASMGGNSSYGDVIRAAFKNNSIVKISALHKFNPVAPGWFLGLTANQLKAKGDADIDTVLAAATVRDYSNLKTLLTLLGRSTKVDLTSDLLIAEMFGGYIWPLTPASEVKVSLGIAKIIDAKVKMATGLSAFESSTAGKSLISQSESDLVKILKDNGISPTMAVTYDYFF